MKSASSSVVPQNKRTTAESYSKEVAQFAVVNKPYNKLFAVRLSETQSSLDTSFCAAEVKSSLLILLYAVRTLHACNWQQLVEIQMVKPFAHWPQMLAETLSQMELRHQPLKHLSTLLDKMKAIKQVQSHVMSCELLNSNKANAGKDWDKA